MPRENSQAQEIPGDRNEQPQRIHESIECLQLLLLHGAACLQGLEVFLDAPTRAISIDDGEHLFRSSDRLCGIEAPFDAGTPSGWIGFQNPQDIQLDAQLLVQRVFDGYSCRADSQFCSAFFTWRWILRAEGALWPTRAERLTSRSTLL